MAESETPRRSVIPDPRLTPRQRLVVSILVTLIVIAASVVAYRLLADANARVYQGAATPDSSISATQH